MYRFLWGSVYIGMDINQRDGFGRDIIELADQVLPADKCFSLYVVIQLALDQKLRQLRSAITIQRATSPGTRVE